MKLTVEQFRNEATRRRSGRARGAAPYTAAQKAFAVQYARDCMARGRGRSAAARDLGIADLTLTAWLEAAPAKATDAEATKLRRVIVQHQQPSAPIAGASALVLVTADGHRVLGLDVASVVEILRALG